MPVSDKFRKASGSTKPVVTSLALPKAAGATTAELTSATGWNTGTGLDYVMYRRELNVTTGQYQEQDGTRIEGRAQLTGTTLSSMTVDAGTEPASGYAADGNTVVFCAPTAQWADDLVDGLLVSHSQNGKLLPAAVNEALGIANTTNSSFTPLSVTPNTVTYLGNRSYSMVFNGSDQTTTVSPGMRLRTQRTVAAPTQSTSLNGTTQYWSKTSPAGMTFTNNFTVSAWVKLSSYQTSWIISRLDAGGNNGWGLGLNASGQLQILGINATADSTVSIQSLPLNKWVHVAATLDMATPSSSMFIDGVSVPFTNTNSAATALVQSGDLVVGGKTGATQLFAGKIAQAAVFSAVLSAATIQSYYSQGLTGSETSLVSAYSFNGNANDLNTTNANNLTATAGAAYTTDSPFGGQADGTISSTLDYAIVQRAVFSTNTTLTVQVPEGCTIPTTGGVASVVYSSNKAPYGFPSTSDKWKLESFLTYGQQANPTGSVWYNLGSHQLVVPVGSWTATIEGNASFGESGGTLSSVNTTLSKASNTEDNKMFSSVGTLNAGSGAAANTNLAVPFSRTDDISTSVAQTYYLNMQGTGLSVPLLDIGSTNSVIRVRNAYL